MPSSVRTLFSLVLVALGAGVARGDLSIQQAFDRLAPHSVTGATIITHGFTPFNNGGGYMLPLAQAIRAELATQTGGPVWLLDYDLVSDGGTGAFNEASSVLPPAAGSQAGHVVLLFDWAPESNETSRWWAESAGDALFSLGAGLGLYNPLTRQAPPVQFIGHSFGTVVTSEAVERLAGYGVEVDQMTLIDPHDFDQADVPTFDEAQAMSQLGAPTGYGTTVWNNVQQADVYYQTRGRQGGLAALATADPEGRPLAGATNLWLDTPYLPAGSNPYGTFGTDSDHGYAWNTFYLSTVAGTLAPGKLPPATPTDYSTTGWAHSIHNANRTPLPPAQFFGANQHHQHSDGSLSSPTGVPNAAGISALGLTPESLSTARWAPETAPGAIVNGDFEAGDRQDASVDLVPGWSHHGGGGDSELLTEQTPSGANRYLQLDSNDDLRTHNWLFVPQNAMRLDFGMRISDASADDLLQVALGATLLATLPLTSPSGWLEQSLAIPLAVRNGVQTLSLRLVFGGNIFDSPEVDFDNFRFSLGGPPGDYNLDGLVDAADYTVWRDALGTVGLGAPADGDLNGAVDLEDLAVWRAHFGEGSLTPAAGVPEPSLLTLLVLCCLTLAGVQRGAVSR